MQTRTKRILIGSIAGLAASAAVTTACCYARNDLQPSYVTSRQSSTATNHEAYREEVMTGTSTPVSPTTPSAYQPQQDEKNKAVSPSTQPVFLVTPQTVEYRTITGSRLEHLTQKSLKLSTEALAIEGDCYIQLYNDYPEAGERNMFVKVGDLTRPQRDEAYLEINLGTGQSHIASDMLKILTPAQLKSGQPVREVDVPLAVTSQRCNALEDRVFTIVQGDVQFTIPKVTIDGQSYAYVKAGKSISKLNLPATGVEPIYFIPITDQTIFKTTIPPTIKGTPFIMVNVPRTAYEERPALRAQERRIAEEQKIASQKAREEQRIAEETRAKEEQARLLKQKADEEAARRAREAPTATDVN